MLVTTDAFLIEEARRGFHPEDSFESYADWRVALENLDGVSLVFVDLLATLETPHRIAGYEEFARAKMSHPVASRVPLVLIAPPKEYELDFMAGWPNFVFGHVQRPMDYRVFRRASTWI